MPRSGRLLPFLLPGGPTLAAALPLGKRGDDDAGAVLGIVLGVGGAVLLVAALAYCCWYGHRRTVQTAAHGPYMVHESNEANVRPPSPGVAPYVPRPPPAVVRAGPAAREEWELQELGRLREHHVRVCHGPVYQG